ncbi:helix-turn-helix domain-containing protein [Streptomyces sp. NBC_00250]|uniref:helix-turn-helix domain-containing protein n=1 Tax=Streptomyces sp. NBC_00250 TaxID=2903641 RepID=UPI003FA7893D
MPQGVASRLEGCWARGLERRRFARQLRALYERGASIRELACGYRRSAAVIVRLLSESGAPLPGSAQHRRTSSRRADAGPDGVRSRPEEEPGRDSADGPMANRPEEDGPSEGSVVGEVFPRLPRGPGLVPRQVRRTAS